jgi:hypothetical protein
MTTITPMKTTMITIFSAYSVSMTGLPHEIS